MVSALEPEVRALLVTRWRIRMAVAVAALAFGALIATLVALSGEGVGWMPVPMWAGVLCAVLAWRALPDRQEGEWRLRPAALWIVAAVALYVATPVVALNLGLAG